jgi:hypothetical protein
LDNNNFDCIHKIKEREYTTIIFPIVI